MLKPVGVGEPRPLHLGSPGSEQPGLLPLVPLLLLPLGPLLDVRLHHVPPLGDDLRAGSHGADEVSKFPRGPVPVGADDVGPLLVLLQLGGQGALPVSPELWEVTRSLGVPVEEALGLSTVSQPPA